MIQPCSPLYSAAFSSASLSPSSVNLRRDQQDQVLIGPWPSTLYLTNDKIIALIWKGGPSSSARSLPVWMPTRRNSITGCAVINACPPGSSPTSSRRTSGRYLAACARRRSRCRDRKKTPAALPSQPAYRHAIVQGREDEGRRDDRVLFHAVTNAELIHPHRQRFAACRDSATGHFFFAVFSAALPG